ncbi:MAG: L,D-transpeptidase [Microcoleaceae cyanobacterium]
MVRGKLGIGYRGILLWIIVLILGEHPRAIATSPPVSTLSVQYTPAQVVTSVLTSVGLPRDILDVASSHAAQLLSPESVNSSVNAPVNSSAAEKSLHLVIRLSDRRVYIYQDNQLHSSYPIAVGREGWETPTGRYQVIQLVRNPAWQHPFTGEIIPPGPENPLGDRWIGFWTDGTNFIGLHGTPNEETVGTAASHGCIRMLNQDVLTLFEKVSVGTPVSVEP